MEGREQVVSFPTCYEHYNLHSVHYRYPEYILQHILQLPSTEPARSLKAALLLYGGYLIQMHNMNSRSVQKEGNRCRIRFSVVLPLYIIGLKFKGISPPTEVMEYLISKFTERQEGSKRVCYSLPVRMKDKIRLHLLVLCLFIDNFTVEFPVLQKDLMITTNK